MLEILDYFWMPTYLWLFMSILLWKIVTSIFVDLVKFANYSPRKQQTHLLLQFYLGLINRLTGTARFINKNIEGTGFRLRLCIPLKTFDPILFTKVPNIISLDCNDDVFKRRNIRSNISQSVGPISVVKSTKHTNTKITVSWGGSMGRYNSNNSIIRQHSPQLGYHPEVVLSI